MACICARSTLWFLYSLNRNWKYVFRRFLLEECKELICHIHVKELSWGEGGYLKKNKVAILIWRCILQLYCNLPKQLCPMALIKQKYHSVMWVGISSIPSCKQKPPPTMHCIYFFWNMQMWWTVITPRTFGWYHLRVGQVQFTIHFRVVFF